MRHYSNRNAPEQPSSPRVGVPEPFEHVSAPVGRVMATAMRRADKRRRKSVQARLKRLHKARKRFWGVYAQWELEPSETNTTELTDAYSRYSQLQALNSLEAR